MYVSAGVWGVATALPVVEPRIQCHYFPDTPRNSTSAPYLPSSSRCSYQNAKNTDSLNFPKTRPFSKIRYHWIGKYFNVLCFIWRISSCPFSWWRLRIYPFSLLILSRWNWQTALSTLSFKKCLLLKFTLRILSASPTSLSLDAMLQLLIQTLITTAQRPAAVFNLCESLCEVLQEETDTVTPDSRSSM